MIKIFLLMVLCHIIDDFVLQPICLSKLKQKDWWLKNAPEEKYKDDYKIALIIHSMSWSIMIMLPLIIYDVEISSVKMLIMFSFNTILHAIIDDLKANKKKINLWVDQKIHFLQIIYTFSFSI